MHMPTYRPNPNDNGTVITNEKGSHDSATPMPNATT
jgi:hypothetical protein